MVRPCVQGHRLRWIADILPVGIGNSTSFGPAGSSNNAMTIAAPRLAAGETKGLFAADLPRLDAELRTHATPGRISD
jgi:hypothetical protein